MKSYEGPLSLKSTATTHVWCVYWPIRSTENEQIHCVLFCSLSSKCPLTAGGRKKQYLHIFSIKLFIQRETLDYALVTGMERSQLYPLVGRVSADGIRERWEACVWGLQCNSNFGMFWRLGEHATVPHTSGDLSSHARGWNLWAGNKSETRQHQLRQH